MEDISSSPTNRLNAPARAAVVPFPSLHPPNPPTDSSEEGTAGTAGGASSGTEDGHDDDDEEGEHHSTSSSLEESSSSSTIDDDQQQHQLSNKNQENDDKKHSSSDTTTSSTPPCQQHPPTTTTQQQQQLPPIPNLIGISDPSYTIKSYLNDLVTCLKKGDGEKKNGSSGRSNWNDVDNKGKNKRRKLDQSVGEEGEKLSASSMATSNNTNSNSNTTTNNEKSNSTNMSHQEEKSSREPIDTIMHWMDSFQDDETIQLMCLQSLPTVLEHPTYRRHAQSDGLASIVLYNMAAFPTNSLLILTAFHTLVVLLRPLGTNEGMVHKASSVAMRERSTMSCTSDKGIRSIRKVSSSGVGGGASGGDGSSTTASTASIHSVNFKSTHSSSSSSNPPKRQSHSSTSTSSSSSVTSNTNLYNPRIKNQLTNWEENGVRVMLDSLRRFSNDRYLQAMGCWAMVNAALYPSLKSGLTRLGGVYAVTNAMMLHPNAEAVQFRGLFALINLVIPERDNNNERSGSSIYSHVYQIARLTILAMKNFHTNKSILNRGCLVLRNLSLTPSFVKILGRTPGCVDMLLHCRQICPRDVLVQRSARTIMVMIQRATENKEQLTSSNSSSGKVRKRHNNNSAHDSHSFTLTQPFPVPSRGEADDVERSTSTTPASSLGESRQKL